MKKREKNAKKKPKQNRTKQKTHTNNNNNKTNDRKQQSQNTDILENVFSSKVNKTLPLRGTAPHIPQKAPKLSFLVLYLKIINIFLQSDICIL